MEYLPQSSPREGFNMRSHTVILGAGATIAAIPNGDKNGKQSSVMNGLIEKLHLEDTLSGIDLKTTSNNLEDIYSEMYSRPECSKELAELENRLYNYFASLELPEKPTVYDFLVLSLTSKDVIATFNWDPLLIQAYIRCNLITDNLPHILCLHGNVDVGYCIEHGEHGSNGTCCPVCGKKLPPTKLLYPVKNKEYDGDQYIKACWDATMHIIENSYMLTIFGYSAPSSDAKAVELLKKAWGKLETRQLEEVSVIDVIDEREMLERWKDFIYSHHYKYTNHFFDSYLGMFPRRSCEMVAAIYQFNLSPDCDKGFHKGMDWYDIRKVLNDVLKEERTVAPGHNYPPHYV